MVILNKIRELSFFKNTKISELLEEKIHTNVLINVQGNYGCLGPKCSGLIIVKLTDSTALKSIIFLNEKLDENKFYSIRAKVKYDVYNIPYCEIIDSKPLHIDENWFKLASKRELTSLLGSDIDISDIIIYHRDTVRKHVYSSEELISDLNYVEAIIDFKATQLILIWKSSPIISDIPIIKRNVYIIPIYDLWRKELEKVIITIMGHVEEI